MRVLHINLNNKNMTNDLPFIELCSRLPYRVKVLYSATNYIMTVKSICTYTRTVELFDDDGHRFAAVPIEDIKLYLRPMSSMTEEEYKELKSISSYYGFAQYKYIGDWCPNYEMVDWLNAHHFDYRGLIPKGLALEAPEGMYKITER